MSDVSGCMWRQASASYTKNLYCNGNIVRWSCDNSRGLGGSPALKGGYVVPTENPFCLRTRAIALDG